MSQAVRCFYRARRVAILQRRGAGVFYFVSTDTRSLVTRAIIHQDYRGLRRNTGGTPSTRTNDVQRPCYLPRDRPCIIASYPLSSTVIEPVVEFAVSVSSANIVNLSLSRRAAVFARSPRTRCSKVGWISGVAHPLLPLSLCSRIKTFPMNLRMDKRIDWTAPLEIGGEAKYIFAMGLSSSSNSETLAQAPIQVALSGGL